MTVKTTLQKQFVALNSYLDLPSNYAIMFLIQTPAYNFAPTRSE